MFGFGATSTKALTKKISDQMVGFQSVMFRLSSEKLGIPSAHINKLEVTFFSMSIVALCVLHFSRHKNKEKALEAAYTNVLSSSLPSSGSTLPMNSVISEFQTRFKQYQHGFNAMIEREIQDPEILLGTFYIDFVSGNTASRAPYITVSILFSQGVTDNIDFAKNVL